MSFLRNKTMDASTTHEHVQTPVPPPVHEAADPEPLVLLTALVVALLLFALSMLLGH